MMVENGSPPARRIGRTSTSMKSVNGNEPGCPGCRVSQGRRVNSALRVPGVKSVDVTMAFEPRRTPDLMTDARTELGFRN